MQTLDITNSASTQGRDLTAVFLELVDRYTQRYPECAFKFYFDGQYHSLVGTGSRVVEVYIKEPNRVFARILTEFSLGLGESYCDGSIEVADADYAEFLFIFIRTFYDRNLLFQAPLADLLQVIKVKLLQPLFSHENRAQNIDAHYSLSDWFANEDDSNDFYLGWLDPVYRLYTCAKWDPNTNTLIEAQRNKLDFYARRLGIDGGSKGKTVLDLGCGWGGVMFYLAEEHGLNVKGMTLSRAQAHFIEGEIKRRGLEGQVSVELNDAHNMQGHYDHIISVGLLEHIADYDDLYCKVARSLSPGGSALFHAMFHESWFYRPDPFLRKYVFAGGGTPYIRKNLQTFAKYFKYVDRNDLPALSYPKTISCWYETFCEKEADIRQLLKAKGQCTDIDFAIRVFKHYLMLAHCGLSVGGIVANVLVREPVTP
jgi:cyclopropane-fatty-acyl-phospholipid synthase